MRTLRGEQALPPNGQDRPSTSTDPGIDATLLPAGQARQAMRAGVDTRNAHQNTRQPRWGLWLGCALALVAVVFTLAAVGGLRGSPSTKTRTSTPSAPPSSQVIVALNGPSTLHVTERLVLPRPVAAVQLTKPDLSADQSLTLPQPVISRLTATFADGTIRVRPTMTGWSAEAAGRQTFARVTIEYDTGNAIISEPQAAVPGRALLVVAPVSAPIARDLNIPVTVRAPGIAVQQATCVTSPATQQLCGHPSSSGQVAQLTSWQKVAVVVLQADLAS